MDHTVIALFALMLNAALGGPRRWYEATGFLRLATLPARTIRHLEQKLNREGRSAADRELRGQVVVAIVILICIVLGFAGGWILQHNLRFVEVVLVATMLPVRPIWDRTMALRKALSASDIASARQPLAGTPWKHHPLLDEYGVARAAIEMLAIDFSEKIVCPVLGYTFFGLPGLFVCKAITFLRDALIHAPEFSKGARMAHSILHTIPARLSAVLWLMSTLFLPSGTISGATKRILNSFLDDGPRALCVRVAATVARVSLGGPGSPYLTQWAEGGTAKVLPPHIRRAQASYLFAAIFLFVLLGAFF